jgi:DAK2 domain fusion protein YloV
MVLSRITSCSGQDLSGMFGAATRWLERSAQAINQLNVFPVPDGDTGINMLLTMRAAMEEAEHSADSNASVVAQAMARGSLMGARGNSGVILSQIFRGLAQGLDGKASFNGTDLAAAFAESSNYAYKAVSRPVEGTILTVVREAAAAAQHVGACADGDILAVLEATVNEARESVARTPSLLPVLRQAGVVDAGGQGLYVVLEGTLRYLRGEPEDAEPAEPTPVTASAEAAQRLAEKTQYGYCTEFLLQGDNLDQEAIQAKLVALGDSVLVVGDESATRVHIHTFDPGAILSYATSLGTLRKVKVENMQDQHRDFIASQPQMLESSISTVTVASGEGLAQAFYSIGATIVVPGGETMNPSVQELLQAVEMAHSDKVIILPNNPNVVLTAKQVETLSKKQVLVVPSKAIPQGIAAQLALNYEQDLQANVAAMNKALSTVSSGEVTRAVRSMELDGLSIREGKAIAFLDGRLVSVSDSLEEAVIELLSHVDLEEFGLVTIYSGAHTETADAEQLVETIKRKYPELDTELVSGNQPHYNYIISVE